MYVESAAAEHDERDEAADVAEAIGHADGDLDAASQQAGEGTLGQKLRASFDQSSYGHGRAAAIAFLLFTLAYTPCLATVAEMRSRHACGETVCRPDPASLVCVGCPFRFFPSSDS